MNYTGPERRSDDVRIALLEQASKEAERRHVENKASLAAVHKRIGESNKTIAETIAAGFADIKQDLKNYRGNMELRIASLEHSRTSIKTVLAGIPILGSLAYLINQVVNAIKVKTG